MRGATTSALKRGRWRARGREGEREGERDGEGIRWAGRLRTRMLTRVQCVCLDTGYVEIVKILIEHGANPNLCELDHVSVPARRCVQRKAARD